MKLPRILVLGVALTALALTACTQEAQQPEQPQEPAGQQTSPGPAARRRQWPCRQGRVQRPGRRPRLAQGDHRQRP